MAAEQYVTQTEAARVLSVSLRTVHNLIRRGDLPAYKIGRNTRVRRSDLDAMATARPIPARSA